MSPEFVLIERIRGVGKPLMCPVKQAFAVVALSAGWLRLLLAIGHEAGHADSHGKLDLFLPVDFHDLSMENRPDFLRLLVD